MLIPVCIGVALVLAIVDLVRSKARSFSTWAIVLIAGALFLERVIP
jgi:hypothetical protein